MIVTLLTEGFADWETAHLNAAARGWYGMEVKFASPDGAPVTSGGGMRVTPDLALGAVDSEAIDALVLCGGAAWATPAAPDIGAAAVAARNAGKLVAAICDAVPALARTGLLDAVPHTGNAAEQLAGTGYAGAAHYRDVPGAVTADGIVTAPGTAPASFMAEVMRALGRGGPELDQYLGMLAAEHRRSA